MADGASVEVAVVGPEGIVGIEAALGGRVAACDATVQVPGDGHAFVMSVDAFRIGFASSPPFRALVSGYAQAFVGFMVQSVACNARHSIEERCCRWLLHAHDRLRTDDLALTHDLLATMLGVRRPTVTLLMNNLVTAAVVSMRRGLVRVIDRQALEQRACGCYRAVAEMYEAVAPRMPKLASGESNL